MAKGNGEKWVPVQVVDAMGELIGKMQLTDCQVLHSDDRWHIWAGVSPVGESLMFIYKHKNGFLMKGVQSVPAPISWNQEKGCGIFAPAIGEVPSSKAKAEVVKVAVPIQGQKVVPAPAPAPAKVAEVPSTPDATNQILAMLQEMSGRLTALETKPKRGKVQA